MCTVALILLPDGTLLGGMNRDERPIRQRGIAPTLHQHSGVTALWPTDTDAGGTWMAATDQGLLFFLLNHYQAAARWQPTAPLSRGSLIPSLIAARDLDQVDARLRSSPGAVIDRLRPFVLVAAHAVAHRPDHGATIAAQTWCWDGVNLVGESASSPWLWTSSGVDPEAAHVARLAAWLPPRAGILAAPSRRHADSVLRAYFAGHRPERGPVSACMHRPEANTVSHGRVHVDARRVAMCYTDGAPCETADGGWQTFARAPESVVTTRNGIDQ